MNYKQIVFVIFASAISASCASIKSIEEPDAGTQDGLTYFMPARDIALTVSVDKNKRIIGVTIGTTAAYPVISKRYVLVHGGNAFGKNTLDVGVTESGLLTSTKSTTVSQVNDVFKNLAASVGSAGSPFLAQSQEAAPPECAAEGPHTFVFPVNASPTEEPCGLTVSVEPLGGKAVDAGNPGNDEKPGTGAGDARMNVSGKTTAGIYYRQNEPYLVTVKGSNLSASTIVFSPSQSSTYFLPVSKTFFANNEAEFELEFGVPTKYKQETGSELLSLLKLPADVIGAYFAAVGQVFDNFKAADTSETAALTESLKLELAKRKYEACIQAIKDEKPARIKELGC